MFNNKDENFTKRAEERLNNFKEEFTEFEEELLFSENIEAILKYIEYLKENKNFMSLSYAIRKFLCERYGTFIENKYYFELKDIRKNVKKFYVNDFNNDDEISEEDLNSYSKIIRIISDVNEVKIKKQVAEKYLLGSSISREGMFKLGFALNMNNEDMIIFFYKVLSQNAYNFRNKKEIVYYFCQSNEEFNNFNIANQLIKEYESSNINKIKSSKENYTDFVLETLPKIKSKNELFDFLRENEEEFNEISKSSYNRFLVLYEEVKKVLKEHKEICKNNKIIYMEKDIKNPEQMARVMLDGVIPREKDFIKRSSSVIKDVVVNIPLADRIRNLLDKKVPVERKDIIFFKFFLFNYDMEKRFKEVEATLEKSFKKNEITNEEKEKRIWQAFQRSNLQDFCFEVNDELNNLGMLPIYPGNKFESLIITSFFFDEPYSFFGEVINNSFEEIYEEYLCN